MRLVYKSTGEPVKVGDRAVVLNRNVTVTYFRTPFTPYDVGTVSIKFDPDPPIYEPDGSVARPINYGLPPAVYVWVIGAEWIEREDRA